MRELIMVFIFVNDLEYLSELILWFVDMKSIQKYIFIYEIQHEKVKISKIKINVY